MPTMLGSKEIGGGFVRLRFTCNGESLAPGTHLTAARIKAMGNGRRLIDTEHIAVYPPPPAAEGQERHIVNLGFGKFDVIEGRKVNARPLPKDEAEALAAQPA